MPPAILLTETIIEQLKAIEMCVYRCKLKIQQIRCLMKEYYKVIENRLTTVENVAILLNDLNS